MSETAIDKISSRYKNFLTKNNISSIIRGGLLFVFAILVSHLSYNYIDSHAVTTSVGDLFLDHLPTINLDIFIIQGAVLLTFAMVLLVIDNPKYLPFTLKTLALFIIIRSFFISLTHLGVNLHQITLNTNSIGFGIYDFLYNAKNDFFFSGHVGATFLAALILWKKPIWRYVFLVGSVIMAASVLLGHMHYSIDVFAAPFIVYGIFTISKYLFEEDYNNIIK